MESFRAVEVKEKKLFACNLAHIAEDFTNVHLSVSLNIRYTRSKNGLNRSENKGSLHKGQTCYSPLTWLQLLEDS